MTLRAPIGQSLRKVFVGVLSHELRTPITSIYGGTQLLLRDGISNELRTSVIRDIAAEAEHLYRLVEDVLAIARIDGGVAPAADEPILLQHQATAAAAWEERHSPGRRVSVTYPDDLPAIRGDEEYVAQILRNLIANAVQDSPADETVQVIVSADESEVAVRILDRGPGITPQAGADAFALFERTPEVASRRADTGIGLFVARILAEVQGGRVWLLPRADGGAETGVALPVYRSAA